MGLASATHRRRHRDILEIIFFSSSPFVFNIQEKTKSLHSLHLTIHNTDLLTCVLSSTLSLLTLPRDILIHNVDGTTSLDYLVSAVTDVTSDCPRWCDEWLSSEVCCCCCCWCCCWSARRGMLMQTTALLLCCWLLRCDAVLHHATTVPTHLQDIEIFSRIVLESQIFGWVSWEFLQNQIHFEWKWRILKTSTYLLSIYCLKRCSAGRVPLDTWTHGLSHRNAATWAKYCI